MNAPSPFLDRVSARHLIRGVPDWGPRPAVGLRPTGTSVSGFDRLNLKPGDTGQCDSSPCQVFVQIPAGTESYVVTGNQATVGTYPTGQNAALGSFWSSRAFQIQGMNVPLGLRHTPSQP